MKYFRRNTFTLEDTQGYINLNNEYEQYNYMSFDRIKKETTAITNDGDKAYSLGDLVIDFITLDNDVLFELFEDDRLELIKNLHLVNANDFEWDFSGELNEFTENYIKKNNLSKDDFAKKLAIWELIERYENMHPYMKMLDFYTAILPNSNDMLLNELLNLKILQQKAKNLAEFCFDIEYEELKKLSAEKRYYFYHASGRGSIPQKFNTRVVALPNKININDYNIFYKTLPKDFDVRRVWELTTLHELRTPQDITEQAVSYLENTDIKLYEAYEVDSISDMVYLELYQMILCNCAIKKCALCGKYFVMKGDYSTKYCDRKVQGKKQTCQQIGAAKDFRKRMSKAPEQVEYMKAYKRMYSRIKYGMITKEKFADWRETAKRKTELCENGKMSLEELKEFLGN